MKKQIFFAVVLGALCLMGCKRNEPEQEVYVDLGLTSGTLWKSKNEASRNSAHFSYFTFDEAKSLYGSSVPTREQWEELRRECQWKWFPANTYHVYGPSGDSILLSGAGRISCEGRNDHTADMCGFYWTSDAFDEETAQSVYFDYGQTPVFNKVYRCCGYSVRLVK